MEFMGGCRTSMGTVPENQGELRKMKSRTRIRLEECTTSLSDNGMVLCPKKSPFDSIPLEVLGNIFLEYYYDEEVQQNCGYFIGANWERWSCSGTSTSDASPSDNSNTSVDDEQQLGHPGAVLGQVCRSWRKVFLTTPRLWSSIRIWLNFPYHFYQSQYLTPSSLGRRESDLDAIIAEVGTHLSRSRAVPLSIEIHTNCLDANVVDEFGTGGKVLNRVLDVLGTSAWRIQNLVVKRTDHARTRGPPRRLPSTSSLPSTSGLVTPPYPASPQSPCGHRIPNTDDVALGALEGFITKLDRLQNLTLDNWAQDAVLDFAAPGEEVVLPALRSVTLLSSSPTFCCNGIPWSQVTHFTSHNCKYNYGQLLDLLRAMPMLTHLDLRLSYNDPGVIPSPYPSPAPSPTPHSRGTIFPHSLERDGSASPRRHTHLQLPSLTHLTLQGLLKSIQLLLGSLKAPHLITLNLNSFEAGIGVTQVLPDQSPCESMFRFLRRSQCALEWMRVDTMFLIPPQPPRSSHQDPNYVYSYILKPTFAPLRSLKTLVIGRGPAEIVVKLLLALAWKGDPSASDVFPKLEEIGCEMKLGHVEADALCAVVMSRIPSGVVFVRQQVTRLGEGQGRRVRETGSARLWPISQVNSLQSSVLEQQPEKFPTRLRALHIPSAKSDIYLKLRHHFRSWFPDFPQDPDFYLPQTFC